jgi:hypothetical protein
MKSIPIPEIQMKDLGNKAFTIDTPSHHISLNNIVLCVAKKQSGKTYFISNLLNQLQQANCMDRIIVVSSTFDSNKKMMENLNIHPDDILDPNDPDVVFKIRTKINQERDDILEYREKIKLWKKFKNTIASIDMEQLEYYTESMLMFYNPETNNFEPPKHRWNGRKPTIGIFCDDIQSSAIIGNKQFKNLTIRHRHEGSFQSGEPPIGCSLFICVQNYTASGNEGIPKSIRGNVNCVALWKTGNMKELDLITTELSGCIPKQKILDAYNYVMDYDPDNRHNFLFIDLSKKKEHPSPFRMNYNEWIIDT